MAPSKKMAKLIYFVFYLLAASAVLASVFSKISEKYQKYIFITLSTPLVLFTAFRPIGLMRDDWYYRTILSWKNEDYFSKISSLRDPLFYAIAWILSHISKNAELLIFLIGFTLTLKLVIIYKLGGANRLLMLFMYMSIYWQLHDLTQLRVSVSVLFFLGFFSFQKYKHNILSGFSIVGSMLSHAQALLNFIFFYKSIYLPRKFIFSTAVVLFGFLAAGITFNFEFLFDVFNFFINIFESQSELKEAFRSHYLAAKLGLHSSNPSFPIILFLASTIYLYSIHSLDREVYNLPHVRVASLSVFMAIFLSWAFASISDAQVRFYEYYFVGGLVIVGDVTRLKALIGLYILAILYFIKFNVKWNLWDWSILENIILNLAFK